MSSGSTVENLLATTNSKIFPPTGYSVWAVWDKVVQKHEAEFVNSPENITRNYGEYGDSSQQIAYSTNVPTVYVNGSNAFLNFIFSSNSTISFNTSYPRLVPANNFFVIKQSYENSPVHVGQVYKALAQSTTNGSVWTTQTSGYYHVKTTYKKGTTFVKAFIAPSSSLYPIAGVYEDQWYEKIA